jgi:hypothetical protein
MSSVDLQALLNLQPYGSRLAYEEFGLSASSGSNQYLKTHPHCNIHAIIQSHILSSKPCDLHGKQVRRELHRQKCFAFSPAS